MRNNNNIYEFLAGLIISCGCSVVLIHKLILFDFILSNYCGILRDVVLLLGMGKVYGYK